uniref:Delta-like protein n=1 Tax=Phallusia mammillata TaxID=59560 RepID=A0A6F9DBT9_9ASCI|nr:Delta-like protein precursor [Phallusia mammillata]
MSTNFVHLLVVLSASLMALTGIAVGKSAETTEVPCPQRCNLFNGVCAPDGQCSCDEGWEGDNCNECIVKTGCMHGSCDQPWQCNCDEGWGGKNCDEDLQYCERHEPCSNGATCVNDRRGGYECACTEGFTGRTCDVAKQPSTVQSAPTTPRQDSAADFSHMCRNGGTCLYGNQIIGCERCACPDGYGGKHCEAFLRMCNTRPCANGGQCENLPGGFKCKCTKGYTGRDCTIDVNECHTLGSNACANNGRCINNIGSYDCLCAEGYEGTRCEMPTRRMPPRQRLNPLTRFFPTITTASPTSTKAESAGVYNGEVEKAPVRPALKKTFEYKNKPEPERQIVTNVKVTHIVEQVVDSPAVGASPQGQASVSVVQAVTFAFLGVAVALFIGIAAFLWFHCSRRQHRAAEAQCADTEIPSSSRAPSVYSQQRTDNRSSFVSTQEEPRKQRDSAYLKNTDYRPTEAARPHRQARPGSAIRTSVSSQRPVDGLYVALPQEGSVARHAERDTLHVEESRAFLPHGRSMH